MKIICIYKILNKINNYFYIGSSINFISRQKQHIYLLKNNKHHSYKLQHQWNVYKQENFEFIIIEYCTEDNILQKEQNYINSLNPKLNISLNSTAPMFGRKHNNETIKKFRLINKGEKNGMYGKTHSEESRKLISINRKKNPITGKKREQWIAKLKDKPGFWKGKNIPIEQRQRLSVTLRKKFPKIGCSNGEIYETQLEASQKLKVRQGHISENIQGKRTSVKGLKFWKI